MQFTNEIDDRSYLVICWLHGRMTADQSGPGDGPSLRGPQPNGAGAYPWQDLAPALATGAPTTCKRGHKSKRVIIVLSLGTPSMWVQT